MYVCMCVKRERKRVLAYTEANVLAHRIKGLSRTRTSKFKSKTLHIHTQIPKMEPIAGNIATGYFYAHEVHQKTPLS